MQAAIKAHKAVQHMAMAVVAIHVAAKNVDYYITKYAAKPMEQLQNLVTQYALGLKRLELEEADSEQQLKAHEASEVRKIAAPVTDWKARGRRVLLRLQYSANRSKWISSTEAALYVHTEQQHWTSHHEVPVFLSRPLYLIWECKRILSSNKAIITRADTATNFSQITYEFQPTATAGGGSHLPATSKTSTVVGDGIHLATAQSPRNAPAP